MDTRMKLGVGGMLAVIGGLGIALLLLLVKAGAHADTSAPADRKATAERFMRGVYGCDPSVVDSLAADDIVISYPIFETIFGTPAIRGHDAVRGLAARFCSRWQDTHVTIHEIVAEDDRVVMLWSFRARSAAPGPQGEAPTNEEHSWGGITFYRFNDTGKIVEEIGLESAPGPIERARNE